MEVTSWKVGAVCIKGVFITRIYLFLEKGDVEEWRMKKYADMLCLAVIIEKTMSNKTENECER